MNSLRHIAIIMDGNGRWGLNKYKSRLAGHHKGIENVKPIINFFLKKKIKILTLYALSFDNYKKRDKSQIENIFDILKKNLLENLNNFKKNKIHLNFIGELNDLPINLNKLLKYCSNHTRIKNYKLKINIAFNYSSKKEIVNAAKNVKSRKLIFNEKNLEKFLYTAKNSNPDIIIRTGGYSRLSDFMLWQASYSELFFVKKLWPDFGTSDLEKIINNFYKINRNFGS